MRSSYQVFEDHLKRALEGDVEGDITHSFAEDCILLTSFGTFQGREGVRQAAELLERQLPNARYQYETRICHGEICLLEWSAEGEGTRVEDGADSFLIQDGLIKVMTIHYTPEAGEPVRRPSG